MFNLLKSNTIINIFRHLDIINCKIRSTMQFNPSLILIDLVRLL